MHEAGHALIAGLETPGLLIRVTLRRSARVPAIACSIRRRRRKPPPLGLIDRTLRQLMAGRAAEALIYGDVSAGSGGSGNSDLAKATTLVLACLTTFASIPATGDWPGSAGMTRRMPRGRSRCDRICRSGSTGGCGRRTGVALRLLGSHRATLTTVVEALLAQETLSGEEVACHLTAGAAKS